MIPLALLLHWITDDEFRDEMLPGEILCGQIAAGTHPSFHLLLLLVFFLSP